MRVRLRDVAERAGVSVKTVSNVVHDYPHVTPATRARVRTVLDQMDYRPNLSARSLRRGRSGVIALALPELDMPYFAELTRYVVEAAEEVGWTVLVDQTDGVRERELLVASGIRAQLLDGLILSPTALGRDDLAGRNDQTPLVLLGEKVGGETADHVAIDNVAAAKAATRHLLDLGRRRVAAIGDQPHGPAGSGIAELRSRGWALALTDAGLPVDDSLLLPVPTYRRVDGAAAMTALVDRRTPPDAVFCFNDTLALGALRALAERGVRVPDDLAVIGLDDVEDGRFAVPSLSTVAPNKAEIARVAVAMLTERLQPGGEEIPPRDVRAGFQLVPRESTGG